MGEQPDKRKLFLKFINNECTASELEEVLAYINASQIPPEFEAVMQENLEQKIAENRKVSPEISARMFKGIQAGLSHAEKEYKIRRLSLKWLAIAASMSVLVLAGLIYFYFPVFDHPALVYTTTYGETEHILLPDGSSVELNANSKLTVSSDWNAALQQDEAFVREVWLEGEGFFEVKKLSKPISFIVHTDDLNVEVLGTKFNVNSREQKTRVVLDEGKVKLSAQNQSELVMNPGELVEVNKKDIRFQKKIVNPKNYIAWRHNELIFEATPMTEIIDMLENNYGYQVVVQQKAVTQEMLFTGKAPADDTELLLNMLSESFNIRILQKDKTIIFQ